MIFVDYYAILEIPFDAVHEDIKKAYRKLSLKYHPDKNKDNPNATLRQQEINEAYYILGNTEKRKVYYIEYIRYQDFIKKLTEQRNTSSSKTTEQNDNGKQKADYNNSQNQSVNEEFEVFDEHLKDWIYEAKKHASKVAKQAAADFKGVVKEGANAALNGLVTVVIGIVVINLIYFIFKSC